MEAAAESERTKEGADVQTHSPKAKDLIGVNDGDHRDPGLLCCNLLPECRGSQDRGYYSLSWLCYAF